MKVRVRDGRIGFYNYERRRSGQVFELVEPELFSERWMEKVDDDVPLDRDMAARDKRVRKIIKEEAEREELERNVI